MALSFIRWEIIVFGPVFKMNKAETMLSFAIMAGLVVIGLLVWGVQNQFNPAVLNLSPASEIIQDPSTPSSNAQPIITLPTKIKAMSPPEQFDSETLSNKINGKAELYLSAGFVSLYTQRFQMVDDATVWLELYLYHMGTPSNAFAVFSTQRRQDVAKLTFTQHAYGTGNALFFTSGSYYVEIIASASGSPITTMLTKLADAVLDRWGGDNEKSDEARGPEQLFPSNNMVSDSLALIAKDAFGFNRFDQVYTAQYQYADMEITLFVSKRGSVKDADALAVAYRDFLIEFGGAELSPPPAPIPEGIFIIEILDSFEIFFSMGSYLAGVHMAEKMDPAIKQAIGLYDHVEDLTMAQPKN